MKNNKRLPNENELYSFLVEVDSSFPVPLSKKQDLLEFSKKLLKRATLVPVWHEDKIVSMVAGYTENITDNMAYISIVATTKEAMGMGYGKRVVKEFIEICRDKKISAVHLYAVPTNLPAVNLYKKLGFVEYKLENEPRIDDLHVIYALRE